MKIRFRHVHNFSLLFDLSFDALLYCTFITGSGVLGKVFRKEQQLVSDHLKAFAMDQSLIMKKSLEETGYVS